MRTRRADNEGNTIAERCDGEAESASMGARAGRGVDQEKASRTGRQIGQTAEREQDNHCLDCCGAWLSFTSQQRASITSRRRGTSTRMCSCMLFSSCCSYTNVTLSVSCCTIKCFHALCRIIMTRIIIIMSRMRPEYSCDSRIGLSRLRCQSQIASNDAMSLCHRNRRCDVRYTVSSASINSWSA